MNRISRIDQGSLAEELEIEIGDLLLSINNRPVVDIIDYMYLTQDDYIEVEIKKSSGEIWVLEIEKDYDESLGIEFENPILDHAKSCTNKCVFCFIDQLPKGMRPSLYFKDDDSRLSFLQGNFVTLTNLRDSDINRIIEYRISPINVSVHTTNPDLRMEMLNNRFAGAIMERLKQITEAGICVNAQIVLCPGYNDGEELTRTLTDLLALYPGVNSVAIVPIGKTRFREGLKQVPSVDVRVARDTLQRIHTFQEKARLAHHTRFAFAADEIYLKAGLPFPDDEAYEGYLQFEDGIGMIRKLTTEVSALLGSKAHSLPKERHVAIVTGVAAYETMVAISNEIMAHFEGVKITVLKIINDYFGHEITVVGLLTGEDVMKQVPKEKTYDAILLPESIFRAEELVLLDDVSLEDLTAHFDTTVCKVKVSGKDLIEHIVNGGTHE